MSKGKMNEEASQVKKERMSKGGKSGEEGKNEEGRKVRRRRKE